MGTFVRGLLCASSSFSTEVRLFDTVKKKI